MDYPVFITNILVHVVVMTIFLTIFFFTIASHQEKNITESQINFLLNDSIKDEISALPDNIKDKLKKHIDDSLEQNKNKLDEEDKAVSNRNKKLTEHMTNLIFIIIVVSSLLFFFAYYYFKWDLSILRSIFTSAIVTLFFVAITEITFLFLIPSNYLAIDPNKVKYKIVNKILTPI